jgi:hypothetical protein
VVEAYLRLGLCSPLQFSALPPQLYHIAFALGTAEVKNGTIAPHQHLASSLLDGRIAKSTFLFHACFTSS